MDSPSDRRKDGDATEGDSLVSPVKKLKYSGNEEEHPPPVDLTPQQAVNVDVNDDQEAARILKKEETTKNGGSVEEEETPVLFADQYHVVKHIMEYLGVGDVLRAGQVNKQWSDIARIVRKQRNNQPFAIINHPYLPHHKLAFEYFNGYQVSEEAKDLVQSGKEGYHPYKQRAYPKQKFGNLLEETKEAMRRCFVKCYDEPQLIVSFGTSSYDTHLLVEQDTHHKKVLKERLKIIMGEVQDSVPCLASFSCGAIVSVPECDNKTLEMEKSKFPCLSSLAIPRVDGLRIKLFTVTKAQNKALKGNESVEMCKELLGIDESDENQLKGIMLLHKSNHRASIVEAILQYLRSNPHVALAGGIHESVLVSGVEDDTIVAAGMLIFGSDLVRVSSVALHEPMISRKNKSKLEKLKSSVLPGETSFGFMFACNGRGRHMHGRPNVEADLFNSLFPKVPLVGAFTFGEYCNDTIRLSEDEDEVRTPPKRIDFGYTTVFLLVSYKHNKVESSQEKVASS